ncbi:MAG TPA: hypothetical protein VEQ10_03710 [Vicinamibacteria bacterium]|nr:hypothetical protein [Vicinamibacteria bacterium]
MLHWLKVAGLLAATILLMRLASWAPLWLSRRRLNWTGWKPAVLWNALALAAFALLLHTQAVPGEVVDTDATLFGLCVYGLFAVVDIRRSRRLE